MLRAYVRDKGKTKQNEIKIRKKIKRVGERERRCQKHCNLRVSQSITSIACIYHRVSKKGESYVGVKRKKFFFFLFFLQTSIYVCARARVYYYIIDNIIFYSFSISSAFARFVIPFFRVVLARKCIFFFL